MSSSTTERSSLSPTGHGILETRLQYPDRSTFKCTQRSRRTDCWRGRKKTLTDSVAEHLLEQPFTTLSTSIYVLLESTIARRMDHIIGVDALYLVGTK
jgi:hypothetical protein